MSFRQLPGGLIFDRLNSSNPLDPHYYRDVLRRGGGDQYDDGFWRIDLINQDEFVWENITVSALLVDPGFDHAGDWIEIAHIEGIAPGLAGWPVTFLGFMYSAELKDTNAFLCVDSDSSTARYLPKKRRMHLWLEASRDQRVFTRKKLVIITESSGILRIKES